MKIACSIIVLLLMAAEAATYVVPIRKRSGVSPALSTWIIFLLGTGVSTGSYIASKQSDFLSGTMILADATVVIIILTAAIIWGNRTIRFRPFEKYYLAGCAVVVVYGALTSDFFGSNLFAQVLLAIGYAPTIQKLLREKRNTEPYAPWILVVVSSIVGVLPAAFGADVLALIYAMRSIMLAGIVLLLMAWCDRRAKQPV